MSQPLIIPEKVIRSHGPGNIFGVCWRQWRTERALTRRGICFRATQPDQIMQAYSALTAEEFEAINGRQNWANWRTIPRALTGKIPDRPLRVLDLGCGAGSSTQVLAFYCPPGSHLTGYELVEPLLRIAKARTFRQRNGAEARVDFVCQEITQPLRQPDGSPIADQVVDLVNASGIVGHHLDEATFQPLLRELRRVLVPGGLASLDVGPTLRPPALTLTMGQAGFQLIGHFRSCWLDPTGQMAFTKMAQELVTK